MITQLFPRTKKYYFQLTYSNSLIYRELYNYFIHNKKRRNTMGITCKQTGKFRGMMRKIENEQLKIKADSVKRKKKEDKKNA